MFTAGAMALLSLVISFIRRRFGERQFKVGNIFRFASVVEFLAVSD